MYDGIYSLYSNVTNSSTIRTTPDNTPQKGEIFRFAFYITTEDRDVRLSWGGGDYRFWRRSTDWDGGNGGEFRLYGPTDFSEVEYNGGNFEFPVNEWGIIEIDFSDPIVASAYRATEYPTNNDPLVSTSITESEYSDGYIRWYANAGGSGEQWYDGLYKTE